MRLPVYNGLKVVGVALTLLMGLPLFGVVVVGVLIGIGNPFFPILLMLAAALFFADVLLHPAKR